MFEKKFLFFPDNCILTNKVVTFVQIDNKKLASKSNFINNNYIKLKKNFIFYMTHAVYKFKFCPSYFFNKYYFMIFNRLTG